MAQFLRAETRKMIDERMKRGGYATADEAVVAALTFLEQHERFGDFAPGELNQLLAAGESSGKFMDGATALAARRQRRQVQRRKNPSAKSA
jgi:Arc/MetJ-type ribon-helix-helix transcriptional regulator